MSQRKAKPKPPHVNRDSGGIAEIRHDGRTLEYRVYINTAQELEAVMDRLEKAAQGPNRDMVLIGAGFYEGDAKALWDPVIEAVKKKRANEN